MIQHPAQHAVRLVEVSLDLLVVIAPDARIVTVSPSWQRVLGYRAQELIGTPIADLQHPDDVQRSQTELERVARGGPTPSFENRYRHADGHYVSLRWTWACGEDGHVYGTARDLSDEGRHQDVERERRMARQQAEIARLGQMALAGTDLSELFDEVCRGVRRSLNTDMADVLEVQDDGSFAFVASEGFGAAACGTVIRAGQRSIARDAMTTQTPLIVGDWRSETRFPYSAQLADSGVRCTAVLPIRGRDGPFGVLATHAASPGVVDAEHDFAFLDTLAAFLTTAIERLRREAEIAALAAIRGRLVAESLEAEERARKRISEELHDGVLQDLLAARQDLVEAVGLDPATRDEMLGYAREGVERAAKHLREAVHALHPVALQHGGLEAALQAAADQAARQGGFRPAVAVQPEAVGLRDELVMSLARELLTNAARHAGAQTVVVSVRREGGAVVLEVADDGCGLDAEAVASAPLQGHIGLASLVQRAEAVGGALDLDAGDGPGTTVRAHLPIE